MMDSNRYEKPVNQGDEIDVTIESTGAKGDGIAKVNNFVVIVPGAKEGEKVRIKITRVLKKMAFAEIVGSQSASSDSSEESYESNDEESNSEEDDQNNEE